MTEPTYYKAVLSLFPGDVEVIGGDRNILMPTLLTAIETIPNATLVRITEQEAIDMLLKNANVGRGCFLSDPVNLIANEERRKRAVDLSIYLATRLGSGVLYDPVEIVTDRVVPVVSVPVDFRNRIRIN